MSAPFLSAAEVATNRQAVLSTYRHLLRATGLAFKGDKPTLTAARSHARQKFSENSTLKSGSPEAGVEVEHAQGVIKILREHVVQGKNMGGEKYKLRIHDETQRLDNDTAGQLKGTTRSFKSIKDAAF